MTFNKILETVTDEQQGSLARQAQKRQQYNRNYQKRIREQAKLDTLHKRVDDRVDDVIAYIKRNYADRYDAWQPPKELDQPSNGFDDWMTLSVEDYTSIKDAYELSGLAGLVVYKDFKRWFLRFYAVDDKGKYKKIK